MVRFRLALVHVVGVVALIVSCSAAAQASDRSDRKATKHQCLRLSDVRGMIPFPGSVVWREAGSPMAGWTQLHRVALEGSAEKIRHLVAGGHAVDEPVAMGESRVQDLVDRADDLMGVLYQGILVDMTIGIEATSFCALFGIADLVNDLGENDYYAEGLIADGPLTELLRDLPGRWTADAIRRFCSPACQDCLVSATEKNNRCANCPKGMRSYVDAVKAAISELELDAERVESAAADAFAKSLVAQAVEGATALHIAAGLGHVAAVEQLIELGADVARSTAFGNNLALHWAALANHGYVIEVLINAGSQSDVRTSGRYTALHLAVLAGGLDGTRALLQSGADVNAKAGNGVVPMDLARVSSYPPIRYYLRSRGAECSMWCHCPTMDVGSRSARR